MSKSDILLGEDVKIGQNVRINVSEFFSIGDRSIIRDNVHIEGRHIEIGKEAFLNEYSHIGGGSCFDYQSYLKIGDFLHLGKNAHINTARRVIIGDECGIGISTQIFTHGAYLPAYDGFPVQFADVKIGNRVWLPNAIVMPGVTIGDNVVVSAMTLVNKDLPSGCLAGGVPVKILKENVYPRILTEAEKISLVNRIADDLLLKLDYNNDKIFLKDGKGSTVFDLKNRVITGRVNDIAEKLKNQLRRYGIRFKYYAHEGFYREWG